MRPALPDHTPEIPRKQFITAEESLQMTASPLATPDRTAPLPKAAQHVATETGRMSLPPKAAQHVATETGRMSLPPKAAQHVATETGRMSLPPKAAQHLALAD
jgi:hypothetical protein